MKKRFFAALCLLAVLVFCLPATAFAEDAKVVTVSTEAELLEQIAVLNESGGELTLRLGGDIQISGTGGTAQTVVSKGTLTILGDGNTLSVACLNVKNDAVLNLGAADGSDTLTVTSHDNTQPVLLISGTVQATLYEGAVIRDSKSAGTCGGVQIEGSSVFNLRGGTIDNCHNLYAYVPGGVLVSNHGRFNFYDGIISNCTGGAGGAVGLNGANVMFGSSEGPVSFYMYGGEIINCTDTDEDLGGGAVWVCTNTSPVIVVIQDGKITGCKGHMGGAIFYYAAHEDASLRIEGGEIYGNTAETFGGGIFAFKGNVTIADGVKLYGNTAKTAGDDIYNNGANVTLGEAAVGTTLPTFGHMVDGWYYDGETRYVCGRPDMAVRYTGTGTLDTSEYALKAAHGHYTVTYTDGVEDAVLFEDQTINNLPYGAALPAFNGTPTREGYDFDGWSPDLAQTVTADMTYTAVWKQKPTEPSEPLEPSGPKPSEPLEPSSPKPSEPLEPSSPKPSEEPVKPTEPEKKPSPATGDDAAVWFAVSALAAAALAGTMICLRKKRSEQ